MKKLFFLILFAAIAWSGYWWIGATAQERGLKTWLTAQRSNGWVADWQTLDVSGYPNRFDTRISDLNLADPRYGWAWSAPDFHVYALSYRPTDVMAFWPRTQRVSTPKGTLTIFSDRMQGRITLEASTQLALDQSHVQIDNMRVTGIDGWDATLSSGEFATRQAEDGSAPGFAHDIYFEAKDLTLPDSIRSVLDRAGQLPQTLSLAELTMTAAFDAPWNRSTIEGPPPELTAASIKDVTVAWGELNLKARGRFDVRADGFAEGELDITARNWRNMLELAVTADAISQDLADTLTSGLNLIARMSGDERTLKVPLTFSDGRTRLGPIPIGPAPRFQRY